MTTTMIIRALRILFLGSVIGLAIPVLSEAATAVAGIPTAASENIDVCFTIQDSVTNSPTDQCYEAVADCVNARDAACPGVAEQVGGGCLSRCQVITPETPGVWEKYTSAAVETTKEVAKDGADLIIGNALKLIAWLFFKLAGLFLVSMSYVLDVAIERTVSEHSYNLIAVNVGWATVRDLTNMFFIFVLLYIAIQTILGISGPNAKRMVANLIVAALLINFSMFFTKVVIDSGNVLAVSFWDRMKVQAGPTTDNSASLVFLEGLKMQTAFDTLAGPNSGSVKIDNFDRAMIYGGGAVIQFIAGFLFLAGAVLMVIRLVQLLLLIIFSPLAFLAFSVPKFSGYASSWLGSLIAQTFVAPVFLFLLWLVSIIIRSTDLQLLTGLNDGTKLALALKGEVSSYAILFNYVVVILMLLSVISITNKFASGMGSAAGGWAKKILGGGMLVGAVGTAAVGRQVLGRIASRYSELDDVQKAAKREGVSGAMARMSLKGADAMKRGSWDVRNAGLNTALGVTGTGISVGNWRQNRSYDKQGAARGTAWAGGDIGSEREKQIFEDAKRIYKDNPEAQDAYIRSKLGKKTVMGEDMKYSMEERFDGKEYKDERGRVNKELAKQEAKKTIESTSEDLRQYDEDVRRLEAEMETLKENEAAVIASGLSGKPLDDVRASITARNAELVSARARLEAPRNEIRRAISALTPDDVAGLDVQKHLSNPAVATLLQGAHFNAINKKYGEGGYGKPEDRAAIDNMVREALRNGTGSAKSAIRSTFKSGTANFNVDLSRELQTAVASGNADEIAQTLKMLDHEGIAEMKSDLLFNPAVIASMNGKTLATISKKYMDDSFYEDVPDFRNRLMAAVAAHGNAKAKAHVAGKAGDKKSMFYTGPVTP